MWAASYSASGTTVSLPLPSPYTVLSLRPVQCPVIAGHVVTLSWRLAIGGTDGGLRDGQTNNKMAKTRELMLYFGPRALVIYTCRFDLPVMVTAACFGLLSLFAPLPLIRSPSVPYDLRQRLQHGIFPHKWG